MNHRLLAGEDGTGRRVRRLLLLVLASVVLLDGGLGFLFGVPLAQTGLGATLGFLRFECPHDDSWGPLWRAQQYVLSGNRSGLYAKVFFHDQVKFQYPPTALLVLKRRILQPALFLDGGEYHNMRAVSWSFVWLTALGVVNIFRLTLAKEAIAPISVSTHLAGGLLWVGLTITFFPLVKAYSLGQIQVWIDGLFGLLLWAWLKDAKGTAGVLLGILCLLKPQYAVLLVWGIVRRQGNLLGAAIGTWTAGFLVSVAQYGLGNHLEYVGVLSFIARHGESFYANQSVNGLLNRLLNNGSSLEWQPNTFAPFSEWVFGGTQISSLALLAAALFWPVKRSARGSAVDLSLMALTATLASPVTWEHHYGICLPIYALLFARLASRPRGNHLVVTGLFASFLLMGNFFPLVNRLAHWPWNLVQSYQLAGGLLLLLALYRIRGMESSSWSAGNAEPPAPVEDGWKDDWDWKAQGLQAVGVDRVRCGRVSNARS
jgi:hypothetical protein